MRVTELKTIDILYELLRDKMDSQIFYNEMAVRMVNPLCRDLFKTFRDEDEKDIHSIREMFLAEESRPMAMKTFIPAGKPGKW